MDGENNGKPYFLMDDLGGVYHPYFSVDTHMIPAYSSIVVFCMSSNKTCETCFLWHQQRKFLRLMTVVKLQLYFLPFTGWEAGVFFFSGAQKRLQQSGSSTTSTKCCGKETKCLNSFKAGVLPTNHKKNLEIPFKIFELATSLSQVSPSKTRWPVPCDVTVVDKIQ